MNASIDNLKGKCLMKAFTEASLSINTSRTISRQPCARAMPLRTASMLRNTLISILGSNEPALHKTNGRCRIASIRM